MPKIAVPRAWPASTVVCLASGPSLTRDDVDYVRGRARAIVVNTTYQLALWADVLYAADARWWAWHKGAPEFAGRKYTLEVAAKKWPGVQCLRKTGAAGLECDPTGLKTGNNSGYQAINLAVHFGASRIILLGYDMAAGPHAQEHWHKDHPNRSRSPYSAFRRRFDSLVEPLARLGIEIVNCTAETALTCFPRRPLREVLT